MPPEEQASRLSNGITDLSHAASQMTGVKSPVFTPHITLFSPRSDSRSDLNEMKRRTEAALREYGGGAVEIVLNNPSAGDRYYQCVLTPVDEAKGRGKDLEKLRSAFCHAFEEDQPFFFPHLSLCYGDLTQGERWRIADAAVKCAEWPMTGRFSEVVIVDINGTADQWQVVERYKL